jgi:hypothetical protein
MKLNIKAGLAVMAVGALVAVPATTLAGPPSNHGNKGKGSNGANHPSHKCVAHNRAYVEGGTVDAQTTAAFANGAWSGTLFVDVTSANHAAKGDIKTTVSVDPTTVKTIRFDDGTTAFTAGEQVQLIGKIQAVAKKCTALNPAPTPVFRMIVVHPAPTS